MGQAARGMTVNSPVNLRFNLEQIATEDFFMVSGSFQCGESHIKNRTKSDNGKVVKNVNQVGIPPSPLVRLASWLGRPLLIQVRMYS